MTEDETGVIQEGWEEREKKNKNTSGQYSERGWRRYCNHKPRRGCYKRVQRQKKILRSSKIIKLKNNPHTL